MTSAASNYDMSLITYGLGLAAVSATLTLFVVAPSLLQGGSSALVSLFIASAYGGMMFTSSYVEEEHHFWYWVTSGWLAYLAGKV